MNSHHPFLNVTAATALFVGFLVVGAAPATAKDVPTWSPKASETLVKLPTRHLEKRLDSDFADSALGQALGGVGDEIRLKTGTLKDLKAAIGEADGELLTELRHQFLAEKKAYLDLVSRRNDMRKRQMQTKIGLFQKLLDRVTDDQASMTPEREELIERQAEARKRFESSFDQVDVKLFGSYAAPESRYNKQYAANLSAIEKLVAKVNRHSANLSAGPEETGVDRRTRLQRMLGDARASLSLLGQEETMVGYMAKLVALDALALAEETAIAEGDETEDALDEAQLTDAVGLFVEE